MNRSRILVFSLALLFCLTSCNDVFYSAISGRLVDHDTQNGISGVNVFAYTSEEDRDRAYSSYVDGTLFFDNDCKFRATTDANGSFTISKIIWKTNKPLWSEDFDSAYVYLILFSEDYGLSKQGPVAVVSESSNQSAVTLSLERKVESSTLELSFKDSSSAGKARDVEDMLNFTYSYFTGYRTIQRDVSTRTGSYSIAINHPRGESVDVKISSITSPDFSWSASESEYLFTVDRPSSAESIELRKEKHNLKDGIYGTVLLNASSYPVLTDSEVCLKIGEDEYKASLSNVEFIGPEANPSYARASFAGLASGVVIDAKHTSDGAIISELLVLEAKDSDGNVIARGELDLAFADSLMCNLK